MQLPLSMSWALGSGTILMGLNSAIIAVALIPIANYYHDRGGIPWLVSGLYIAAAVGSPLGGRFADLFGPRRVYLIGLAVIIAASAAGPFLPSVGWLILDRIVLGLGTSLQFPAAMAIIRQQAAARKASAVRALGIVAVCGQTTAALGPTIGGLVTLLWGWQGIFWVNVPFVVNSLVWVLLAVPKDPRGRRAGGARSMLAKIDPLGIALLIAALVLLMLGLLSLESHPQWPYLLGVIPIVAVLVLWERRSASPFIDVRLFAQYPGVAMTCLRGVATFVSFYCIFYGFPQWLEESRGLNPGQAGLLVFPTFGIGVVSTVLATRLGHRLAPRVLLLIGNAAMVAAGALIVLTIRTDAPIWLLIIAGAMMGIPNGFNNLGNQMILHDNVPGAVAGIASGLYRTSQYIGATLAAVICAFALRPESLNGGITIIGACVGGIGAALLLLNPLQFRSAGRKAVADLLGAER
ncbi:MAG TPA: MFS transporter [Gryllotalpicola sp.]